MGLLGIRPARPIRLTTHFPHLIHGAWRLVSTQGLPGTSRTHGWRVMGPLLPTRMAPTVLPAAAAHICRSLSTVLTAVVARRVTRVTPGTARRGEELVESRGGRWLRVPHVTPLIAVRCSRCWLLLLG